MRIATTLFAATLLALAVPAAAQEVGGLRVAPGAKGGPVGIARPLPEVNTWITAADLQRGMSPTERQSLHQGMISRLRGDAGFLGGFAFGQPVAPSRQVQVADDGGFGFDGGFVDGGFVPGGGFASGGAPPPPQPADHHQQSGAAGRHQRQRQRGAAADGDQPRADRPAAADRHRSGRRTQPGHRRRQHRPARAWHTLGKREAAPM